MERRSESITYVISQAKMEALSHRSVIQHLRSSLTTSLHHPSKLLCPMTKVLLWMNDHFTVRFRLVTWRRSPKQGSDEFAQRYFLFFVDGKSNGSRSFQKTMLTFFSLTGLFNQGNVFRSSNRDFLCRGSLVLHRVSVSSSNGCVRLRWLAIWAI